MREEDGAGWDWSWDCSSSSSEEEEETAGSGAKFVFAGVGGFGQGAVRSEAGEVEGSAGVVGRVGRVDLGGVGGVVASDVVVSFGRAEGPGLSRTWEGIACQMSSVVGESVVFLEVEGVEGSALLGEVEEVEFLVAELENSVEVEVASRVVEVEVEGSGASSNSRGSDAESRGDRSGWRHAVERWW
jgi:hypothetical protein